MKLVNMKMAPEDMYPKPETSSPAQAGPIYPWGLTLRLEEAVIAKLGLKELPEVETVLKLEARVLVTEVSSRDEIVNGQKQTCRSLCLQVTDLGLGKAADEKEASKTLYDKD